MAALIVLTGDSHTDGTGAPPGQSWPAQMARLLDRPDLVVVNLARAGAPLAEQIASWNATVAPILSEATDLKIVFGMGGYNDIARDHASAADIVRTYRLLGEMGRAASARIVCGLDVIRFDGDGVANAIVQAVNATLRREGGTFCDAQVDFAAEPLFNRAAGPYPQPPFAADRVHLDATGQQMMAALAKPVFERLLAGSV